DKRAPGIVGGHAEAAREAFLQAGLPRMVDGRRAIAALANDALIGRHAHRTGHARSGGDRWITVDTLEQPGPFGAQIARAQHETAGQLALKLEGELLGYRRAEIDVDDGAHQD